MGTHAPSEHAGSVKGAAAIVNQGSAGKYFGTSGHSGTHTSGYVTIPEAQTQDTVKFAASHLNMLTQATTNPISAAIAAHSAGAHTAVGIGGIGHGEVQKHKSTAFQSDFDGQDSGHDFNSGSWHPPFGSVNSWDGARDEGFRDYK